MEKQKEYEAFCVELISAVREQFAPDVTVEVHKITKNNAIELDGLNILIPGESISPNFYLQHFFESFMRGDSVETLASEIVEAYFLSLQQKDKMDIDLSYDFCKSRIVFRLVSYKLNEGIAESIPYIPFLDMMITFHALVRQDEDGIGSIRITNALMDQWQVDTKTLFNLARENTERLFPSKICGMFSMMIDLLKNSVMDRAKEEEIQALLEENDVNEPYVVTNTSGINGAAVILYHDVLEMVASELGGDFYILPSSIHEILAVPARSAVTKEELREMVCDVNGKCVAREEILSESVYKYIQDLKKIELCFALQ